MEMNTNMRKLIFFAQKEAEIRSVPLLQTVTGFFQLILSYQSSLNRVNFKIHQLQS